VENAAIILPSGMTVIRLLPPLTIGYIGITDNNIIELIFEWDEIKARNNLRRHRVDFNEAKTVFNDPFFIPFKDVNHSEMENGHVSILRSMMAQLCWNRMCVNISRIRMQ